VPGVNELDWWSMRLVGTVGWQRLFSGGGDGRLGNSVDIVDVERTVLAARQSATLSGSKRLLERVANLPIPTAYV
jgi:hypothetical protein